MRRREASGPRPVAFALDALADTLEPPTLLAAVQRAWPDVAGLVRATSPSRSPSATASSPSRATAPSSRTSST